VFFVRRPACPVQVAQVIFFKNNFHVGSFDATKILLFFEIRKKATIFKSKAQKNRYLILFFTDSSCPK
jgi:hypothetical protein